MAFSVSKSLSLNIVQYSNIFTSYLKSEAITTLDLDSSFNGHSFKLPKCIFNVRNAKTLSLRNNQLSVLPPEIAKLQHLKVLRLSNNKLRNDSIPYTLTHCQEITTLLLDNNALDAVPGFVLELKKLETLHRHGNQNYFRTTFMWYVCEGRERIRTASFSDVDTASAALECVTNVQSLMFWAAKSIISRKCNYFLLSSIPESVKDYISEVYSLFNVCAACNTAELLYSTGYIVFTFKNPYINNTCVPFLHWTCSKECALAIELPARMQQIKTAQKQVKAYESYVRACALGGQPIIEEDPVSTETDLSDESRPAGRRRRWKLRRCNIM
ncbi:hypothetical protein EB796_024470 [Bugula neritina]|uniref:LRRC63 n=1 Tax=Bugula neritina TaxID=10212 RepID=A0A7J7ITJ2_BUGNE|nr:hypothetical protein EB796_024470 [Bugula neritina]